MKLEPRMIREGFYVVKTNWDGVFTIENISKSMWKIKHDTDHPEGETEWHTETFTEARKLVAQLIKE